MTIEDQRHKVCQWLQRTDPSSTHYGAQKNYEPETGNWLLRSPDWKKWVEAEHQSLWIHGIPGAGKTVLISHLIEQVKNHCEKSTKKAVYVYYYCHFSHNQDETTPFLRWVLNQLCRQANFVPTSVYDMYQYGGEPSIINLLKGLEDVLEVFEVAYIIVDALDESKPRDDLLRVLRDFVTDSRFRKIQLLASSREYIDIEATMAAFSVPVSMNNPFVEKDIKLHVRSSLQRNQKFKRWPKDLLGEVEVALSRGAKGM